MKIAISANYWQYWQYLVFYLTIPFFIMPLEYITDHQEVKIANVVST